MPRIVLNYIVADFLELVDTIDDLPEHVPQDDSLAILAGDFQLILGVVLLALCDHAEQFLQSGAFIILGEVDFFFVVSIQQINGLFPKVL